MVRRARRATGFIRDFQEFIAKGSVVDLAVGVIIGGAFGKIVQAMVDNLIMPIINPVMKALGDDWRTATIPANSKDGILIGAFIGSVVDFLIIAFVLFLIIKAIAKFQRQEAAAAEEEAAIAPDPNIVAQEKLTAAIENLTNKIQPNQSF
jgi:large conductance mechanosensitive channel